MSETREAELSFSSSYSTEKITVASLEDLEKLCDKYDNRLIINIGKDGKLSTVEVYDDYRE